MKFAHDSFAHTLANGQAQQQHERADGDAEQSQGGADFLLPQSRKGQGYEIGETHRDAPRALPTIPYPV